MRAAVSAVCDPELPGLTVAELGILRSVDRRDGRVVVTLTPTFSGCPALDVIRSDVERAIAGTGVDAVVELALAPPWSSGWITAAGRAKLAAAGIAPPPVHGPVPVSLGVGRPTPCPRCGSADTTLLAAYASTACLSLRRCDHCREPFDAVKAV